MTENNPITCRLVLYKGKAGVDAEIEKLVRDHARSRDKLTNIDYLERASAEVVFREQSRSTEIEATIQHLHEQRKRVESLK